MINKFEVGQSLLVANTSKLGLPESRGKILQVVEACEGFTLMSDNAWYPNMYLLTEITPRPSVTGLEKWTTQELIDEIVRRNNDAVENN